MRAILESTGGKAMKRAVIPVVILAAALFAPASQAQKKKLSVQIVNRQAS
jgi:hypothetical protein